MRRLISAIRDDSGFGLAVVMMAAAILFVMASTVLAYTSYRTGATHQVVTGDKAMYLADAGIDEYVYKLSQNATYADTVANRTLTGSVTGIGTWVVTATPADANNPLTLVSVATLSDGSTKRIRATIFPQSFADYVVLVGSPTVDYSIGPDATFSGKVRANANIKNDGVIQGRAEAGLRCLTGSGGTPSASFKAAHYPGDYTNNAKIVDFSQLTNNWADLQSYATAAGTYYPKASTIQAGALGYKITMNGSSVNIDIVTAGPNTNIPRTGTGEPTPPDPPLGTLTFKSPRYVTSKAIPAKGVFFFDDTVWVAGNYGANITIMTSGTMYCADNVTPTNSAANYTCGLAAKTSMLFPFWYTTMPDQQTVQAATLCQEGGVGPDDGSGLTFYKQTYNTKNKTWSGWSSTSYAPATKGKITLKGARAMNNMIGFSSGYDIRQFDMDPNLATNPPPKYPTIPGGLHVETWNQN